MLIKNSIFFNNNPSQINNHQFAAKYLVASENQKKSCFCSISPAPFRWPHLVLFYFRIYCVNFFQMSEIIDVEGRIWFMR